MFPAKTGVIQLEPPWLITNRQNHA